MDGIGDSGESGGGGDVAGEQMCDGSEEPIMTKGLDPNGDLMWGVSRTGGAVFVGGVVGKGD